MAANVPSESLESNYNYTLKTPPKNSPQMTFLPLDESPINPQPVNTFYATSTPRIDQQKTYLNHQKGPNRERDQEKGHSNSFLRKSEMKNVLADYIVNEPLTARKNSKKRSGWDTPKAWNYQSGVALPLYKQPQQQQTELNINDKEAFPMIGDGSSKKEIQKKKRINPTRVVTSSNYFFDNSTFKTNGRMLFGIPRKQTEQNVFLMATETKAKSLDQERKLLKEKRETLLKEKNENLTQTSTNTISSDTSSNSLPSMISSPNTTDELLSISQVTSQEELNILANLYSSLILCNMVPNIMVELYFILQLLTIDIKSDFVSDISIFCSNNNCVYFAVKTLSMLTNCLALFDRSLLRSLSENDRIQNFDVHFQDKLRYIMETSCPVKSSLKPYPKSPILNVSFQSETDNKNNFPTTTAFQMFRKQRDLFYEVNKIYIVK